MNENQTPRTLVAVVFDIQNGFLKFHNKITEDFNEVMRNSKFNAVIDAVYKNVLIKYIPKALKLGNTDNPLEYAKNRENIEEIAKEVPYHCCMCYIIIDSFSKAGRKNAFSSVETNIYDSQIDEKNASKPLSILYRVEDINKIVINGTWEEQVYGLKQLINNQDYINAILDELAYYNRNVPLTGVHKKG
jgi:hypothetical protein